jgi:hypothetical protein
MKNLFTLLLIALPLVCKAQVVTQHIIGTAGGGDQNETYANSWTIGEVVTETFSLESLTLTQGFHQGNLIIDWIGKDIPPKFKIKAYPNPTKDIIIIELQDPGLDYQLINVKGRVIQNGIFFSLQEQIDFTQIPAGTYFLKVKDYKTHKIVKQ